MPMTPAPREFQSVRIGDALFPFTTCEEVSRAYRATIEHLGIGGSETPPCRIMNTRGIEVGHVSYNGRVWEGPAFLWEAGARPLYDPSGFYGDPQDLYRIARRFAEKLQSMLSENEWAELCARNKEQGDPLVCVSHDYCDANLPMDEAFAEIMGRKSDPASDEDAIIWGKAWSLAKSFEFRTPPALENAA